MSTPQSPCPQHWDATGQPTRATVTEPLLYTPAEAAQRLRVRESWLRKKAAAREVPCTFLGKHLRFSPTDLAAIIANSARPAVGRSGRRKTPPTVRDRDLPPGPRRSVHAHVNDHTSNGSTSWRG
ncbi:helix-turn-helix domain-containing protein [Planosporangium thailandense]|uniref:helix-turn-helix domain-containing protein n=1 Tax=Planosporangium thailandense TaxID=765197 RepID=UPI0030B82901